MFSKKRGFISGTILPLLLLAVFQEFVIGKTDPSIFMDVNRDATNQNIVVNPSADTEKPKL